MFNYTLRLWQLPRGLQLLSQREIGSYRPEASTVKILLKKNPFIILYKFSKGVEKNRKRKAFGILAPRDHFKICCASNLPSRPFSIQIEP